MTEERTIKENPPTRTALSQDGTHPGKTPGFQILPLIRRSYGENEPLILPTRPPPVLPFFLSIRPDDVAACGKDDQAFSPC